MKLTRTFLVDVKVRCLRKRIWFRALKQVERSLMDLTIRLVDEVRSSRLAGLLEEIVYRLEDVLEDTWVRRALEAGSVLVERLARVAYSWGHVEALGWIRDRGFTLYLGATRMNCPDMFGCVP